MGMAHITVYMMQVNTHDIKLNYRKKKWCCTLLIPALVRQRQVHLCKFEVGLVYKVSPGQPVLHRETMSQKAEQNIYMHLYYLYVYNMWVSPITPLLHVGVNECDPSTWDEAHKEAGGSGIQDLS